MEDETGVQAESAAAATQQETQDAGQAQAQAEVQATEPVDETGVPLKNREAEAARKARKAMSASQAESAILSGRTAESPAYDQSDAIKIVESIAEQRISKRLEPLLAKQFLNDNPDAVEMIEDINQIRASYPELSGIDRLELAYKVAKANRQEEIIRQRVESRRQEEAATLEKSNQAALEGTGRTKAPSKNMSEQISSANSLEDLAKLEAALTSR